MYKVVKNIVAEERYHPDIVEDHAKLYSLIEIIEARLREETANYQIVSAELRELIRLAREHFGNEEFIMKSEEYPKLDYHVENHCHLVKCLSDYVALCEKGLLKIDADAGKNIRDWFLFHTRTVDEEFHEWLLNKRRQTGGI